ncbi:hypothetical protein ACOME3_001184 [Neoechinorhynchus agilis]
MVSNGFGELTLSIVGPIASVGLFLSGMDLCREIKEKETTDSVSPMPFILSLTCASYWLAYGILCHLPSIIASNTIGVCLEFIYCVYYALKPGSKHRFGVTLSLIVLMSAVTGIVLGFQTEEAVRRLIGLICVFLAIFMFASPLDSMCNVVNQRATSGMSFKLSFMTLLAGIIWASYGIVLADYYVFLPNMIGCCLGIIQVTLFLIFPRQ